MDELEKIIKQIEDFPEEKLAEYNENYKDFFNNANHNNALINELREELISEGLKEKDIMAMREAFSAQMNEYKNSDFSAARLETLKLVIEKTQEVLDEIVLRGLHPIIAVPIELISKEAVIPTYAHRSDAGMDLYSPIDVTIKAGETKLIPLGFKIALPTNYEFQVRPRSGMSLKTKIRVANAPGTIDSGYRSEVGVILDNIGTEDYEVKLGDRIAQGVLKQVPVCEFVVTNKLMKSDREGGFGSTGV